MRSPKTSITKGYDIHVVFSNEHEEEAQTLFDLCLTFLTENNISYQKHRIFSRPVGPWPTPMWQFILPSSDQVYHDLGLCIAWFMLNRGIFSVMIHPNTQQEDEHGGALEDHTQSHLWLGSPLELNVDIFKRST